MSLQLQAIVSLNKDGFTGGLSSMSAMVSNVTGAMSMAFGGVAAEILAMGKAFGPVGVAMAALKNVSVAGIEIEQAMADVASLTAEGSAAISSFGKIADEVTRTTKFGFTDVSAAMKMFAAAGYESADAMANILKPGLDLAAAGGTSTANAVSVMVSALKTFSLDAKEATNVANLFAGGANVSMASVESLGESMTYAGSIAAAYGMSLQETIGVLSLYSDKGMQGSVAGTAFAQSMAALTNAAKEGKTAIGSALADWNPAAEGMAGAIKRLETAGVSAKDVLGEFGRQGGKAVASLLNSGSAAIVDYTAKVASVGDAAGVAAQRQDTLGGSVADLKGEFQRLQFVLSSVTSDSLKRFVDGMVEATQGVVKLLQSMTSGDWESISGMIRGLGVAIMETMTKAVADVRGTDWAAMWTGLRDGFVASVNFWYGHVADVWGRVADFLRGIDGASLWAGLRTASIQVWEEIQAIALGIFPTIRTYAENVWAAVAQSSRIAFEAMRQASGGTDWGQEFGRIRTAAVVAFNAAYQAAMDWIGSTVSAVRNFDWASLAMTVTTWVLEARTYIIDQFKAFADSGIVSEIFERIGKAIGTVMRVAFEAFGGFLAAVFENIKSGAYWTDLKNFFSSQLKVAFQAAVGIAKGILEGLFGPNLIENIVAGARLLMLDIKRAIQQKVGDILAVFGELMVGIITKTSNGAATVARVFGFEGMSEKIKARSKEFSQAFEMGTNVMTEAAARTGKEIQDLESYLNDLNAPAKATEKTMAGAAGAIDDVADAAGKMAASVPVVSGFLDDYQARTKAATAATYDEVMAFNSLALPVGKAKAAVAELAPAAQAVADDTAKASEGVKDLAKSMDGMTKQAKDFKTAKLTASDISAFTMGLRQLKESLTGQNFDFSALKLPNFAGFKLPNISQHDVSKFATSLRLLVMSLTGIPLGSLKIPDFSKFDLPKLDNSAVTKFLAALQTLKAGMMKLDFGELGRMDIKVAADKTGAAKSLDQILALLKGARGVVWA